METVEIVVYIGVAVILGGLVIGFIVDIDTEGIYESVRGTFAGESSIGYTSVDADEMASTAFRVWNECGLGQRDYELVVSLEGEDDLTKQRLFDWYEKFNLCHSIQSETYDCGNREDVELDDIEPPALTSISCNSTIEKLIIEEI